MVRDLGRALAELASLGSGAEGAGEGRSKDHPTITHPCLHALHPDGNTPGAMSKAGTQEAVHTPWHPSKHDRMYWRRGTRSCIQHGLGVGRTSSP